MHTSVRRQSIIKYGLVGILFFVLLVPSFSLAAAFPDLTVTNPSVSSATLNPSQAYTIYVTVSNIGSGNAPGTTLRYYLSTDRTISTADSEVATDSTLPFLGSGNVKYDSDSPAQINAPATPGTYWVGACVDTVPDESDTTNQCSAEIKITVVGPDMIISSFSSNLTTLISGSHASFTINATAKNQGAVTADATTLRYYMSTDATITTGDTELDTDTIPSLLAGLASPQSTSVTTPAPGTYWVGACVDSVAGESNTTNQCSTGVEINVVAPDMVVISSSVSESNLTAGQSFTIYATLKNQGTYSTSGVTMRYYLSADATVTTGDTELGSDTLGGFFPADATWPADLLTTAPVSAGTYWVGACSDTVANESDTTNQCSSAVEIIVSQPDLTVISPSVSSPAIDAGQSFTINATVENQGAGVAATTTLRFFLSTDSTISTGDSELATDPVSSLAAGATSAQNSSVTAPAIGGTYWVGACVDTVSYETDTANQCASGVEITVADPRPDLIVTSPYVRAYNMAGNIVNTSDLTTAQPFQLAATVENQGLATAGATTSRFYISTDSTITTSDNGLETDTVDSILAGNTDYTSTWQMMAPSSTGTYWVGVCVDVVTGESNTTNQCSSGFQINVTGPELPDLTVISPSVSATDVTSNQSLTISATVENQGGAIADATTLFYYLSTNSIISRSDTELATDSVGSLTAGTTSPQDTTIMVPATPGTFWVGACVGPLVTGELNYKNQCSAGLMITITPGSGPDLIVTSPSVNTTPLSSEQSFSILATIENQGTDTAAASTIRYYLSTDSTISTSDTVLTSEAVTSLASSATLPEDASVTAPVAGGTYWVGVCVDTVTNEVDITNQCSSGVEIIVNGPDLIVTTPVASATDVTSGQSFDLAATVENLGTATADATILHYFLSTNDIISIYDTELATDSVPSLGVGANSTQTASVTAPAAGGTYWVGACVDAIATESDKVNQCSSGFAINVTGPPTVTTHAVSDITATSATGNGSITILGLPTPDQYGVCWNTIGNPSATDNCTDEGAATIAGTFTSQITGLILGTKYYVRAYATNSIGTTYGNQVSFIAGSSMVTFASPSTDSIGLDYDESRGGVWLASEDGHIYLIDAKSQATMKDISLIGNTPAGNGNTEGVAVLENGNLLLTDYEGDGVTIDDYLFEFNPDTNTVVNYWPLDGSWNTSTDGSSINQIIDVEKDSNGHVYVTSSADNNIYELILIDGKPGSWSTVNVTPVPVVGNALGLDLLCENKAGYVWAVSDFNSTNVGLLDDTFAEANQFSGAHGTNTKNTGVTIIPGNPAQMWVTDFTTNLIGIFEIEQIDCNKFPWAMFLPAMTSGKK